VLLCHHHRPFLPPSPSHLAQGEWSRDAAYAYLNFVLNFSQIWALYCLAGFYLELRPELNAAGLSPLGKFATVKAIVFFSWWCVHPRTPPHPPHPTPPHVLPGTRA